MEVQPVGQITPVCGNRICCCKRKDLGVCEVICLNNYDFDEMLLRKENQEEQYTH